MKSIFILLVIAVASCRKSQPHTEATWLVNCYVEAASAISECGKKTGDSIVTKYYNVVVSDAVFVTSMTGTVEFYETDSVSKRYWIYRKLVKLITVN